MNKTITLNITLNLVQAGDIRLPWYELRQELTQRLAERPALANRAAIALDNIQRNNPIPESAWKELHYQVALEAACTMAREYVDGALGAEPSFGEGLTALVAKKEWTARVDSVKREKARLDRQLAEVIDYLAV
jgi:hypothetical protein